MTFPGIFPQAQSPRQKSGPSRCEEPLCANWSSGDHRQARPLVLAVPLVTAARGKHDTHGGHDAHAEGQTVPLPRPRFYCLRKTCWQVFGHRRGSTKDAPSTVSFLKLLIDFLCLRKTLAASVHRKSFMRGGFRYVWCWSHC